VQVVCPFLLSLLLVGSSLVGVFVLAAFASCFLLLASCLLVLLLLLRLLVLAV